MLDRFHFTSSKIQWANTTRTVQNGNIVRGIKRKLKISKKKLTTTISIRNLKNGNKRNKDGRLSGT